MVTWTAPLRDYQFIITELLDPETLSTLPGYADATPDLTLAVLEEAGRFCAGTLLPINRSGDSEGCRIEQGRVRTPSGFRDAYRLFSAGGWTSINADPVFGGQGLPQLLGTLVGEMISATNHAFGMYPGLNHAAYEALLAHGSEDLKQTYLPKLVSGEWLGAMDLTEPQCGTDLGLTRSRAEPADDGTYRLTGTKMFISGGDHDLTDNIVHLVLARLPGAPPGTRGISMFLVPLLLPAEAGSEPAINRLSCGSLEHKMGIRGSATCVMNFDGAIGWLVGEPHKGMSAMFTMMNLARLSVAVQGVGLAEAALQSARAYAHDRAQGRASGAPRYPDRPADPLVVHPDIRRMLLTIRAYVEGGRALNGWIAEAIDVSHRHPDADRRQAADDLVSLLTPVAKAFLSDVGFESCVMAQQVFGGHGYIAEWGMEQLVRDARVTQIYEGANGIQALDLVGRKLNLMDGRLFSGFLGQVVSELGHAASDPRIADLAGACLEAFRLLETATAALANRQPLEKAAGATDYLRLFGLCTLGYLWTRMARIAIDRQADDQTGFYRGKLATARFYVMRILPQTQAYAAAALADSTPMLGLADCDI